jgi:hypothetical protein
MERIIIQLPDGRRIKRVLHSKYFANNSPCWVIVNGIKFSVCYYDLNDTNCNIWRLEFCYKEDFLKGKNPSIFHTSRPKAKDSKLLAVEGSPFDNEYYDCIVASWIKTIKR